MIKSIFRLSLLYAVIEGGQKGILFLLTPLITKSMSTEEYGIVSSGLMVISFLSVTCSLSLHGALSRYYYRYSGKMRDLFVSSIFIFLACILVGASIFLLWIGKTFFLYFLPEIAYFPLIGCIFLVSVLQPIVICFLGLVKVQQDIQTFLYYYSGYFFTQIALLLIYVVWLHLEASGYLWALLISNALFAVIAFLILARRIVFGFDWRFISLSTRYSISVLPVDLISLVNSLVDRYYIIMFIGLAGVGQYFVGVQIAALISMALLSVNSAYVPLFFKKVEGKEKDFSRFYFLGDLVVLLGAVLGLFVSLYVPYFIKFFYVEAYWKVTEFVVYLIYSSAILGVYFINTNILALNVQLARIKSLIIFIGLLVNIVFNYVLTKKYGLQGAAASTLISISFITCSYILVVLKKTQYRFNNIRHMVFFFSSLLIALETQFLVIKESRYTFTEKSIILCGYTAVMLLYIFKQFIYDKLVIERRLHKYSIQQYLHNSFSKSYIMLSEMTRKLWK